MHHWRGVGASGAPHVPERARDPARREGARRRRRASRESAALPTEHPVGTGLRRTSAAGRGDRCRVARLECRAPTVPRPSRARGPATQCGRQTAGSPRSVRRASRQGRARFRGGPPSARQYVRATPGALQLRPALRVGQMTECGSALGAACLAWLMRAQPTATSARPNARKPRSQASCPSTGVDVMEAEDLVVDDPLDEVEEPPAEQQRAAERTARPRNVRTTRGAPQHRHSGGHEDPCGGVKKPVPHHVDLHRYEVDGHDPGGQHVVPLQDLVEDDAVDESAEPDTQEHAGGQHRTEVGTLSFGWSSRSLLAPGGVAIDRTHLRRERRATHPMQPHGQDRHEARTEPR